MPFHNAPKARHRGATEPEGGGPIPLASLALMIEIAETTVENDIGGEQAIHAREGVPAYRGVDVQGATITRIWSAQGSSFRARRQVAFGDPIASVASSGLAGATDRL